MILEIALALALGIYLTSLGVVTGYCLLQVYLLLRYLLPSEKSSEAEPLSEFRRVTVQLPVYNEKNVIERLIESVCRLDWPRDKFEIQVLDDSTDETSKIIDACCLRYRQEGIDIHCLRRKDRSGFKAGALKEGVSTAKGELIAIFDADFVPNSDFLLRTVPYFKDDRLGLVQARWAHLNQHDSLLTELQAFQLNVHFTIEQTGRWNAGYFSQFNGTAGVWRKECIEDAGGWQADTLTEDLDLSFRAQMNGWQCLYLENVTAPAELPADIASLKSQQFRWMKGGAETARKLIPSVWTSGRSLVIRLHAIAHLLASSVFVFVVLLGLSSIVLALGFCVGPQSGVRAALSYVDWVVYVMPVWMLVYYTANVVRAWPGRSIGMKTVKFISFFPVFLAVSMAIALHNSLAVIQGWMGRKSAFVRTPKRGALNARVVSHAIEKKWASKIPPLAFAELLVGALFLVACITSVTCAHHPFLYFHLLSGVGYLILVSFHFRSHAPE
jgi:cellulose synthase/poly-beta-1,6-N-acetylglucosamine synthase-like glycosyltransferase